MEKLESLPWYEAEQDCQLRGGNLAVISSQAENDLIYAEMGSDDNLWWIGLSNYGKLDHGLAWTTKEQRVSCEEKITLKTPFSTKTDTKTGQKVKNQKPIIQLKHYVSSN